MRAAVPGDVLAKKALQRQKGTAAPEAAGKGTETKIKGSDPTVQPMANASENPIPHIGKVFFTLGGTDYVCSANSVASTNRSTVSTAGHCLNEGPGAFATRFTFVPAYLNGAAPYGKWTARALYAPTEWSSSGNMQYDTGFAVMSPLNGSNLADVVGASGVRFNAAAASATRRSVTRPHHPSTGNPPRAARAPPPTIPTIRSSTHKASPAT